MPRMACPELGYSGERIVRRQRRHQRGGGCAPTLRGHAGPTRQELLMSDDL